MRFIFITLIALVHFGNSIYAQEISLGLRDSVESTVLGESRSMRIYLPPSYGESPNQTFPVMYIMDGDYNFRYVTGLIEQMSAISEQIPEMIVVGISDKGHEQYVLNCTPHDSLINPAGNSERFAAFISDELKPYVCSKYACSSFDFLAGHSLGGLLVVNTLLNTPEKFQNYIAISPSLWWNDYAASLELPAFFDLYDNIDRSLFLSLGNEKGMGVFGFVDQLDVGDFRDTYLKRTPLGLKHTFRQYPDENHNSVGLLSYRDALLWRFEGYEIKSGDWLILVDFESFVARIAPFKRMIGDGYRIPPNYLKVYVEKAFTAGDDAQQAMQDFLASEIPVSLPDYFAALGGIQLENDDVESAILTYRKAMEQQPNNPHVYSGLSDCFQKKEDRGMAVHYAEKALQVAKANGARSWYINQLQANVNEIK